MSYSGVLIFHSLIFRSPKSDGRKRKNTSVSSDTPKAAQRKNKGTAETNKASPDGVRETIVTAVNGDCGSVKAEAILPDPQKATEIEIKETPSCPANHDDRTSAKTEIPEKATEAKTDEKPGTGGTPGKKRGPKPKDEKTLNNNKRRRKSLAARSCERGRCPAVRPLCFAGATEK